MMVACKLAYPNHMHITRGNHETCEMNAMYGFKGEMLHKYDERLYQIFSEVSCAGQLPGPAPGAQLSCKLPCCILPLEETSNGRLLLFSFVCAVGVPLVAAGLCSEQQSICSSWRSISSAKCNTGRHTQD